jgi:colanic acid/amylovoran biosynthesis glycosyltransferase
VAQYVRADRLKPFKTRFDKIFRPNLDTPEEPPEFDKLEACLRSMTTTWSPDVVQCHFGPLGSMAAMLKSKGALSCPISTVFHGYDITKSKDISRWKDYRQLFAMGDGFIGISDLWCRRLLDLGAPVRKIHAVKLGIDTSAFEYRDRTTLNGEPFRISSVGRMTEKKGHEYTIRALAVLKRHAPDFNIRLDVIGSGELLQDMQQLVAREGLTSTVTLHGARSRESVMELLGNSNAFALHSVTAADGDKEGIPVSIMEAMAMGLPILSTIHSGIPELVKAEETGLLAHERDYISIAENIADLATHPARAKEMGQKGRERVCELHERKTQSDLMAETLEKIAAES